MSSNIDNYYVWEEEGYWTFRRVLPAREIDGHFSSRIL